MTGDLSEDMIKMAMDVAHFIDKDLPLIVETEGLNHFKDSFVNEGFTDDKLEKWKPRKTVDKYGVQITNYRTNKVGKAGELNAYGRRNRGRKILSGHNTGANKLGNSISAVIGKRKVTFRTYKKYAQIHNEGGEHMPQRKFMGTSVALINNIRSKEKKVLNNILKNG